MAQQPWQSLAVGLAAGAAAACVLPYVFKLVYPPPSRETDICRGMEGLIGNTKLVNLEALSRECGCTVLAKMESSNPGGSTKDRIALNIILQAEEAGLLRPGGTIIEGTAGSTGISLALLARARGYKCIIVMADDMAMEKELTLKTLGAQVHRVKAVSIVNDNHYCKVAERLAAELPNAFYVDQFENAANFDAHYRYTGPEIWRQARGQVDAFVMGAGTGGTLAGIGSYLFEQNSNVRVCLVDPPGSALYLKGELLHLVIVVFVCLMAFSMQLRAGCYLPPNRQSVSCNATATTPSWRGLALIASQPTLLKPCPT